MRLAGAVCLSGGSNLPVSLLVRREWWWADGRATGHGNGLGPVGCRVRLRKVKVPRIETMHPGRGIPLERSCGSAVLNFHALRFASRKAMLFLQTGGRIPR